MPVGISKIISEFETLIIWKTCAGSVSGQKIEIPEPQKGIDQEFDHANIVVD